MWQLAVSVLEHLVHLANDSATFTNLPTTNTTTTRTTTTTTRTRKTTQPKTQSPKTLSQLDGLGGLRLSRRGGPRPPRLKWILGVGLDIGSYSSYFRPVVLGFRLQLLAFMGFRLFSNKWKYSVSACFVANLAAHSCHYPTLLLGLYGL